SPHRPPAPEPYTLSLHDALPICPAFGHRLGDGADLLLRFDGAGAGDDRESVEPDADVPDGDDCLRFLWGLVCLALHGLLLSKTRSEEHTSELQSRENLVCRLLLE